MNMNKARIFGFKVTVDDAIASKPIIDVCKAAIKSSQDTIAINSLTFKDCLQLNLVAFVGDSIDCNVAALDAFSKRAASKPEVVKNQMIDHSSGFGLGMITGMLI